MKKRTLLTTKHWVVPGLALVTFIINQFPSFIERFYSTGLYPVLSRIMRIMFGWLPFSVGDVLYILLIIWLLVKLVRLVKRIRRKELRKPLLLQKLVSTVFILLILYTSFNWMWGFNYNRPGSAAQLKLKLDYYDSTALLRFTDTINSRLHALVNDPLFSDTAVLQNQHNIDTACVSAYRNTAAQFPFLKYETLSVKRCTWGSWSNYMGFLGYINPFTLEAQINRSVPNFLLPYTTAHEMAHQLGYASESEANLVGYLACKNSSNAVVRYSVYYDLANYALAELSGVDTGALRNRYNALPERVKADRKLTRAFFSQYKNPAQPVIDWLYDRFLKMNNQPKGRQSYNQVVGWLIAYAQKYGWDQI